VNLAVAALLVAGIGLLTARTPAAARFCAWCVVLGFAVLALDPQRVHFEPRTPRTAAAETGQGDVAARTHALAAAAAAGPRAADLALTWSDALGDGVGRGPLGATARLPIPALPLQPGQLQVRALGGCTVDRPLLLQLEAPVLQQPLDGVLTLYSGEREVFREAVSLGKSPPAECTFTAAAPGTHRIELLAEIGGHRVVCRGELAVAAAPRVLVLEPSRTAAAALRAQGVAVEEAASLPADWRTAAALVVGQGLPAADQQAIVAAVIDGMGLFVLAPGFGAAEEPLRAILPVRPLPIEPKPDGPGPGGQPGTEPPSTPPTSPPEDEPPSGDTRGASPVSKDPIEVDKHSIAMVLLVDRSGSMGTVLRDGRTKMSYAKTSARRTAQALDQGDQVAIVTFGNKDAGRAELPLTDATNTKAVGAGIERLAHAPENTFLLSGLRVAHELLRPSRAAVKHLVIITDGEFRTEESMALRSLAHSMRANDKITLSIISIVDSQTDVQFTKEAELLTRDGGGQFFPVEDVSAVPVFVTAEVTRSLQRVGRQPRNAPGSSNAPPTQPPPSKPKVDPPKPAPAPPPEPVVQRIAVRAVAESRLLEPAPQEKWPTLGAAVAGTAPFDAQVLLVAGENGWPLLCYANRGLGRVGAFAADLCGDAGGEFRAERAFPARLATWIQGVLPAEGVRTPKSLLDAWEVKPIAPTPHDVELLAGIAGQAPVGPDHPAVAPAPAVVRTVVSAVPDWALWAVLALVVLALCERWTGLRSFRLGRV
jgi:Mg-chelatase subunit ChlD